MSTFKYPIFPKNGLTETFHGVSITNDFKELEDPESELTKTFVAQQNNLMESLLKGSDIRDKFKSALTKLMNYPKFGIPRKEGGRYYYFYNSGLQAQSVLMCQAGLGDQPEVFFDPNHLSVDGTISLSDYSFSESGKYFAYSLSESGSDWVTIKVRSVDSDKDLENPLHWVKFSSIQWSHDDKGFFYNQYPKPGIEPHSLGTEIDANKSPTLFYHKIGTPQEQDIPIYQDENPDCLISCEISDDGKFLILYITQSCDPNAKVWIKGLNEPLTNITAPFDFIKLVDNFENSYNYLTNDGNIFFFETTLNAPKKRIVKCDISEGDFVEIVRETMDVIATSAVFDNNKLVVVRLQDVKHVAAVYNLYDGSFMYFLPVPNGSIINSLSGKRKLSEFFYSISSFITPGTSYRFNFTSQKQTIHKETEIKGLKSDDFQTNQVFYHSKDGTKIPMFLTHKKGMKLDGSNPVLLYGKNFLTLAYGGFNHAITPSFSASWILFARNMDGVVAVANIRGGSEYGNDWYNEGRLKNKQNCFDDFQYAAKYLVEAKYTVPSKICINGGSNGGLLVAACANQAPQLFGCCIADVGNLFLTAGVMDMLRFHRYTIGHAWVSDYGNPDLKEDFEALLKYSPIHNVKKQQYPSYMITTSDHDDRVVPHHSLKLLATLQSVNPDNLKPIIGRIETKAGHGAGKSTQQRIDEASDKFAFLGLSLGINYKE